ncbi:MAG TPA: DUF3037 domain-containing protein [Tepidiformaceae bacterium]|nr:DUF3037 domain-containing protein [Tepidiformaceae bacterium]
MPARSVYEYAVVRVVPRVDREEFLNVGVVLFCKNERFLAMQWRIDEPRVAAFAAGLDLDGVRDQLAAMSLVCAGNPEAGELARLTQAERFRWVTAPRSTIVQLSPVRLGECVDAARELAGLMARLVEQAPSGVKQG